MGIIKLLILEYLIINTQGLFHKLLANINLEKYPENMTLKILQRNNEEIIFFSTDISRVEFILSLVQNVNGVINVNLQYNKITNTSNFNTLCNCSRCTDTILDFHLNYKDKKIFVSCNNGIPFFLKIGERRGFSHQQIFIGNNNFNNMKPLHGCLLDFKYKDHSQVIVPLDQTLFTKCKPLCTMDLCNGGQCIETYSESICDCTRTSKNGQFCKENGLQTNGSNFYQLKNNFNFTYLKVSWNSRQRNFIILEIKTNYSIIQIYVNNSKEIILKERKMRKIICENKKNVVQNIMFINVIKDSLTFECNNGNGTFVMESKPFVFENINIGFSEYLINNINLKGFIDLVYKNMSSKYQWIRPTFNKKIIIDNLEVSILIMVYTGIFITFLISLIIVAQIIKLCEKCHKSQSIKIRDFGKDHKTERHLPNKVVTSLTSDELGTYEALNYDVQGNIEELDYIIMKSSMDEEDYVVMTPTLPPRNV